MVTHAFTSTLSGFMMCILAFSGVNDAMYVNTLRVCSRTWVYAFKGSAASWSGPGLSGSLGA